MVALLAMRRGAKILNVGMRTEDTDCPTEALRDTIASILKIEAFFRSRVR